MPFGIQSPFVAHPDGATVEPRGMRPLLIERASGMNHTVTGHIIMIADGSKPSSLVAGYYGL
jgi:hypothetical protein